MPGNTQVAPDLPCKCAEYDDVHDVVLDVSHQRARIYLFAKNGNDEEVRVVHPNTLVVTENGSHYIVDDYGYGTVIPPGWLSLEIEPKAGLHPFTAEVGTPIPVALYDVKSNPATDSNPFSVTHSIKFQPLKSICDLPKCDDVLFYDEAFGYFVGFRTNGKIYDSQDGSEVGIRDRDLSWSLLPKLWREPRDC